MLNPTPHVTCMNRANISQDLLRKIGMILGREISPSEEGCNGCFSEFSNSDISDFRLLGEKSGVLAVSYIKFRLAGKVELNSIVSYYASVIQQDISFEEWNASEG